jgi:hypothetical protein
MDVVSTDEVPAGERFTYWRELNSKLYVPYDLRRDPRSQSDFRARVGFSAFGPVQAALATVVPHATHRTLKLIRQADPEVRSLLPLPSKDLRRLTAVRIAGDTGIGALSSQFLLHGDWDGNGGDGIGYVRAVAGGLEWTVRNGVAGTVSVVTASESSTRRGVTSNGISATAPIRVFPSTTSTTVRRSDGVAVSW